MNLNKNHSLALVIFVLLTILSACLDEQEEEFDVVGGVGTISIFNISDAAPSVNETITLDLTFFSEREPVQELILTASIDGETPTVVESRQITGFNTADSQLETFNYLVPAEANGRTIEFEAEIITANNLSNTRSAGIEVPEDAPAITISSVVNNLPFGDVIETGELIYTLEINQDPGILYRELEEVRSYYSISGGTEVPADTITISASRAIIEFGVTIPGGSEGEPVVFRFEAESTKPGITSVTGTPENVVSPTPLGTNVTATVTADETDTIAYDMVNFTAVPTAGPADDKDVLITSSGGNVVSLMAMNGTEFVENDDSLLDNLSLNTTILAHQAGTATNEIEITRVGDIFTARLRDTEDYVMFVVTDLTITETSAEVVLEISAP